jgi:hypothetical protein
VPHLPDNQEVAMTREQQLVIKASDLYIDASNAFTELHDLIRDDIRTPFHPAAEIAEIFSIQLKRLFEMLADDFQLDITVKTTFKLRKPRLHIPPG